MQYFELKNEQFFSCVTTNGKRQYSESFDSFIPYFIRRPCDVGGSVSFF